MIILLPVVIVIDIINSTPILEPFKRAWKSNTTFSNTAIGKKKNYPEIRVSTIGSWSPRSLNLHIIIGEY